MGHGLPCPFLCVLYASWYRMTPNHAGRLPLTTLKTPTPKFLLTTDDDRCDGFPPGNPGLNLPGILKRVRGYPESGGFLISVDVIYKRIARYCR